MRIAFYLERAFHRAILEPIHSRICGRWPSRITDDPAHVVEFNPRVVVSAGNHFNWIRALLPNSLIVWTRHGFSSKKVLDATVRGCDIACLSSAWVEREMIRQGVRPRIGFWVTGFPGADAMFSAALHRRGTGRPNVLYAPTYNRGLSAAGVLGNR